MSRTHRDATKPDRMGIFGTILDLAILWLIVTLATRSTDAGQSYRETWIAIFGSALVGLAAHALLGRHLWPVASLAQLGTLYGLVGWSCGTDRNTTLRICGWFLVATLAVHGGIAWLVRSR